MVYARITENNVVIATTINKPKDMTEWTAVQGTLPPRPIADGAEPRLILKDGALVWQVGKTREEVQAERKRAYIERVDPITAEISRLRDMGGSEEEIADAMRRRERAVAAVKAEFPYAEG